jgi:hypothetical protein
VSLANPETSAALSLLNAKAVRERAHRMLAIGLEDKLPNFRIHLDRMDSAVDLVLETTRKAYPSLEVPFHSRWRHFVTNNDNRWADVADQTQWPDPAARARAEFDLAIVSVFLDAGAGPSWRYHDPKTGLAIGRSEGLGLASLAMFESGAFSANPLEPLRVDADVLANLCVADLERGLQVSDANPLVGLEGRVDLLRRLGALVASKPDVFGRFDTPRPGRNNSLRTLAAAWGDLAIAADVGRRRARRLLEAPGADDGGRDQRLDAPAQALAMAGLLSDRTAANRRHPRNRYRRSHRPCRIPQRRPVRRWRRARVSRRGRCAARA